MAGITDPLYPYFQYVASNKTCVPVFRELVQSEAGLEYLLEKLPPRFRDEVRLHHSQGRAAVEDGEWEGAESSFLQCKRLLTEASTYVKKEEYDFLLAWADHPLAQLYQLRGTAEATSTDLDLRAHMLLKALAVRKEMLDCVLPLENSRPLLVKVCKSYYSTALYEYGDLVKLPKMKHDAVHLLSETMTRKTDAVEAHVCILLWCDHFYSGNTELSLRWIRKANQLCKESNRDWDCLGKEADLCIKLGKFREAVGILEELSSSCISRGYDQREIHQRLHLCYMHMSTTAEPDEAELFKGLALSYSDPPLGRDENQGETSGDCVNNRDGNPESQWPPEQFRTPLPIHVGSWLGLVQADMSIPGHKLHLQKLPAPIQILLQTHLKLADSGNQNIDWEEATCNYQMCREFLKIIKRIVDPETHYWLLAWFDLPLAHLYQYRLKKYEKAVEIWKEMIVCAKHLMPDESLMRGYQLNLDLVEYEWKRASQSEDHFEIPRRMVKSSLLVADEKAAELELCFWLYFHHYTRGNYKDSLEWLQDAVKLQQEHRPDQDCRKDRTEYFCCEYSFLRCEADLWMRLQMFEKAISTLKNLLETRHIHDRTPRTAREAREARQWLHKCKSLSSLSGLECDSVIDDHELEEIVDESSSATGCCTVWEAGVSEYQLIQSQTGLEQHLHKLPVPIHLAFERFSNFGHMAQLFRDWETAIFNYEWCKELLKCSRKSMPEATYAWLIVWTNVPLVELYEYGTMQHRKALDLLIEMYCWVSKHSLENLQLRSVLVARISFGMYECAVSEHPQLKAEVIGRGVRVGDYWFSEERCLLFLFRKNFERGNFEASWKYLHQVNEHLRRLQQENADYLASEATCLVKLGRIDEANELLKMYWARSNKNLQDLPTVKYGFTLVTGKVDRSLDIQLADRLFEDRLSSELVKLRLDSETFEEKGEYEKAMKCHEACLKKIGEPENRVSLHATIIPTKAYDYLRLGLLQTKMFEQEMGEFLRENSVFSLNIFMEKFLQNEESSFNSAVEHFDNCIQLPSSHLHALDVALASFSVVCLFGHVDELYGGHLIQLYDQFCSCLSGVGSSSCSADVDILQSSVLLYKEITEYLAYDNPMSGYAKIASSHLSDPLHGMRSHVNVEGWIGTLETFSMMYTLLQSHYYRRATLASVLNQFLVSENQVTVEHNRWRAFVYAERERTRAMLYQTGSDRLNHTAFRKLWTFDVSDSSAENALRRDCASLLQRDAVFVQYSRLPDGKTYLIYVVDQKGDLSVTHTKMEREMKESGSTRTRSVAKSLATLYRFLEPKRRDSISVEELEKELEFLYDVLIEPIQVHLQKMNTEHKLILAPSQLLTKVPFAALRNSRTGTYLIQHHTIALISSLRALKICTERLEDLQSLPAKIGLGSIVVLGNPAYNACTACHKLAPLKGSEKEVEFIANAFGETAVVKLLGEKGTVEHLLDWMARPPRENIRQVLVHIAAHARVSDEGNHGRNVLHLACPQPTAGHSEMATGSNDRDSSEPSGGQHDYNVDQETAIDTFEVLGEENSEEPENGPDIDKVFEVVQGEMKRIYSSKHSIVVDSGGSVVESSTSGNNWHDLTADKICSSDRKWNAELVVLSACRSSRGKSTGAEGVLSLARAFMIAGVPCTVASSWMVDDAATVALMTSFYQELQKGNDVSSALRNAMLEKMDKYPVKDWAPFSVWGVPTLQIPDALQQIRQ